MELRLLGDALTLIPTTSVDLVGRIGHVKGVVVEDTCNVTVC